MFRENGRTGGWTDVGNDNTRRPNWPRIKSPEVRSTDTRLRIDNNVYSSCMRSEVVGTSTCPVCFKGEDTIKHLLFSCQHFKKQMIEIDDKMYKALSNWPSFNISTTFKLLLDLQYPDCLFQTCCTYVHGLYSEWENIFDYFRCRNLNIARLI